VKLRNVHFYNPAFTKARTVTYVPEAEVIDGFVFFTVDGTVIVKGIHELKQAEPVPVETVQPEPQENPKPAPVQPQVRRRKS
jgi:hypothetical protein